MEVSPVGSSKSAKRPLLAIVLIFPMKGSPLMGIHSRIPVGMIVAGRSEGVALSGDSLKWKKAATASARRIKRATARSVIFVFLALAPPRVRAGGWLPM